MERDIHDGAQQHLVALAVKLRLARTVAERDPGRAGPMLDELREEVDEALETLRDLARDVYPAVLADRGLVAAIRSAAERSPQDVRVVDRGIDRYAQEIETAVYFCVLETLQNAARYASASQVTVELSADAGTLTFTVRDDGVGFDAATRHRGRGLQNLEDRLASLDGTVTIGSRPGVGTTVAGRIPLPGTLVGARGDDPDPGLADALSVELDAELRRRGDEIAALCDTIRASRQRIVAAQDAERRRMERDIHDGAQQQLVAMSMKVGLVGQLLDRDLDRALGLLDDLGADANLALEDLRDLARGIFPPLLDEQGLVAALDAHVRKHALPVSIVADPVVTAQRAPQEPEVAAYFCCLEAIRNATEHAPGVPVTVRLSRDDRDLTFAIHDEGPGFDPTRPQQGTGLQDMSDRVAALGGTLTIASTPGAGTTVTGRIPAVVMAA